jgi:uncharacterized membrane protein
MNCFRLLTLYFFPVVNSFGVGVMSYGVLRHFQQYFSYTVVVSFIGGGNKTP